MVRGGGEATANFGSYFPGFNKMGRASTRDPKSFPLLTDTAASAQGGE